MKTLKEVNLEIEQKIEEGRNASQTGNSKLYNKLSLRVGFLRKCQHYLEGEPREEFVVSEQKRMDDKKKAIESGYYEWKKFQVASNKDDTALRSEYNALMGMKDINLQLKTLNYLLS